MSAPLILVTNDDGIQAEGLTALADRLEALGEVWVVAPASQQSAMSHALTLHKPLRVRTYTPRRYSVSGTPTDSVFCGVLHLLPRQPDLVVSGINRGANLGDDVSYSGTVSAALEAAIMGIPGIAASHIDHRKPDYSDGAEFCARLAQKVLDAGLPDRSYVNVNFPAVPRGETKGTKVTFLGHRTYSDTIVEAKDPRGKPYYWIGGADPVFTDIPGSDCNAVAEGFISITPLQADPTDRSQMERLNGWKMESW